MIKNINQVDQIFLLLVAFSFVFWVFAKIPIMYEFLLFDIAYQAGWMFVAVGAVVSTLYFLYRWIRHKFKFSEIHFYGFLLGVVTLLIMRFIY
ncbi:MAG: hypothetical protein ACQESK_08925 [Bacteroidota bacterium]